VPGVGSSGIFYLIKSSNLKSIHMKNIKKNRNLLDYNQVVKDAYFQIVNQTIQLISSLGEEPLRGILERQDKPNKVDGYIVHELINPLIYIRLEAYKDDMLGIHYGYEQNDLFTRYYPITSAFIRSVYKCTTKENTKINIEACVHTDWVITNCAELYEYIAERNKCHILKTLRLTKVADIQGRILEKT
jgi:hypothetical protein